MKNLKKLLTVFLVSILCLSTLVACGNDKDKPSNSDKGNSGSKVEQTFKFSSNSDATGLNPMINTTGPDNGVYDLIYETLISEVTDENSNAVIRPAAAEKWDISDDGTVYTFHIREDAVWSDGEPVTADDFVFTFRTMATPEVGSTNAWLFEDVILNYTEALYNDGKTAEYDKKPEDIGVKAIDDKTVEFTLTKPYSYFLDLLTGAKPVRQDKYEEYGNEYGSSVDKIVMNGPFVVDSWDQNVQMTFLKNNEYWNAKNVKLEKIERKLIQDAATAAQALMNGDIDVVGTNDPDWQKLIGEDERFDTLIAPDNAPEFLGFNVGNKYFKNEKIRLAFSLALDREKYIEDILKGQGEPLYSLIPSVTNIGEELYNEAVNNENQVLKDLMEKYPDPKALLIEGLKEEGLDEDPSKMKISYSTRGTTEFSKKSGEWLLQNWEEKLGVRVAINMLEWNVMWDKFDVGDYDIATAGWGPYYNDPNALLELYEPKNGYFNSKKSGWDNEDSKKYTELLKKASNSTDNDERAELFVEAEKLLVGTGVIAPTYVRTSTVFKDKKLKGYNLNPHSALDYAGMYIEE